MRTIDLRSDTVTLPTAAMHRAMAEAQLGDDVLGDDPTVAALERRCAELAGKDAAVFVPSGTMANLLAISVHTRPGDEVLMEAEAHTFVYESAGGSAVAGIQPRVVAGERGVMAPADVRAAIRGEDVHFPRTALLCVEDTHNRGGGRIQPLDNTDALCELALAHGIATHLDGARLLNAAVASGTTVARRARDFDTVCFCFSKALGCPVGSILCGPDDKIALARRIRKRLGGGMRQAGLLAAAGLHALDHHVDRLADDHRRAAAVSEGLRAAGLDAEVPDTNILRVGLPDAPAAAEALGTHGVRCFAVAPDRLRLVFHLGVGDDDVEPVIRAFREIARA
ncbi:MAG: GntG family PLP-dependent aldolase [Myxococcota bacterium]